MLHTNNHYISIIWEETLTRRVTKYTKRKVVWKVKRPFPKVEKSPFGALKSHQKCTGGGCHFGEQGPAVPWLEKKKSRFKDLPAFYLCLHFLTLALVSFIPSQMIPFFSNLTMGSVASVLPQLLLLPPCDVSFIQSGFSDLLCREMVL